VIQYYANVGGRSAARSCFRFQNQGRVLTKNFLPAATWIRGRSAYQDEASGLTYDVHAESKCNPSTVLKRARSLHNFVGDFPPNVPSQLAGVSALRVDCWRKQLLPVARRHPCTDSHGYTTGNASVTGATSTSRPTIRRRVAQSGARLRQYPLQHARSDQYRQRQQTAYRLDLF
jgi:hypothetical protein